jgi:hypothetical protein
MKELVALGFLLLGVVGGIYVGCYEFFIKGIVLILDTIKATPINSFSLALGIFKVMFATFFGWCTFGLCVLISQAIDEC